MQRQLDQRRLLRVRQDELARARESCGKSVLSAFLSSMIFACVNSPRLKSNTSSLQQLQDAHAVLAQRLGSFRGADEIRDERCPPLRPVVFQDLHQDVVDLVDERAMPAETSRRRC